MNNSASSDRLASVAAAPAASRVWTSLDFDRDGKQSGFLHVPHSTDFSAYGTVAIPIVCIRNGDGPTALLTAGNHGDEYEGQVALLRLARALRPEQLRGRVILIPALNFPAVHAGRRASPLDEGNLNRLFPGDPNGGPTAMLAHYIGSVLFALSDLVIDLHSGGRSLDYAHCALAQHGRDDVQRARVDTLLQVFGAPYSILTSGQGGGGATTLYAAAAQRGLPALTTELGKGGTLDPVGLRRAEQGVRRVLRHYGIAPDLDCEAASPTRLLRSLGPRAGIYAHCDGLFEPLAEAGQEVRAGQLAGYLHRYDDPLRDAEALYFQADGVVSCRRFPALAHRGDCLYHLAA
ncbi:succinylglutamate desuccinylase [Bordetella genomosp. 9]|uniref:succinylglutamate desuccinylase/aspartoacylase family protein n=1 Tax=Bordetella genomosp. 9 TaxID=1416803 RepID=UPI000A291A82|nr:succinylglutamate desuccinylase/aspartoacylase family protein [Bordetella genomosp. 9]ARP89409.1 succinylglutamate desuccinylase [Bordetella genomosp. 9]